MIIHVTWNILKWNWTPQSLMTHCTYKHSVLLVQMKTKWHPRILIRTKTIQSAFFLFICFSRIPPNAYQTITPILKHFNCATVATKTVNDRNKTSRCITERVTSVELQKQRNSVRVRALVNQRKEKQSLLIEKRGQWKINSTISEDDDANKHCPVRLSHLATGRNS